jgi:hypothetical protein
VSGRPERSPRCRYMIRVICVGGTGMVGAIDKRDILAHPLVTIRCFGWRVFLRAIFAGPNQTFLSVLAEAEVLKPAADNVVEFVARCVELELRAGRVYAALSRRFAATRSVQQFFAVLASQEECHAELLELCRAAAAQRRWNENQVAPWRDVVPRLERRMAVAEASVGDIQTLRPALQLVVDIESSEINEVFRSIVAASESEFVRRLTVFGESEKRHLAFIRRGIAELDPEVADVDRLLQNRAVGCR